MHEHDPPTSLKRRQRILMVVADAALLQELGRAAGPLTVVSTTRDAVDALHTARAAGDPFATAIVDVRSIEIVTRLRREDAELDVVVCTLCSDRELIDQVAALVRSHAERDGMLRHSHKLEALGRLASGLAHELNTPLQFSGDNASFLADAVRSLTALVDVYRGALASTSAPAALRDRVEQAEAQADLEFMSEQMPQAVQDLEQGLRRVAGIVKALRSFSSVDQPETAYVDLNTSLRDTLAVCEGDLRDVAAVELDLRPMPMVLCRPGDLNQVFHGLIRNAAQAMLDVKKAGGALGRLRVASRQEGSDVVIEFADTGGGIRDDIKNHIFEPFFTTREVGKGPGLGLSVARTIVVNGHGGTLTFESVVAKGTTFRLRLPLKPAVLCSVPVPLLVEVA